MHSAAMTIFAVLLPSSQPALVEAIKAAYQEDFFQLSDTQFLVSDSNVTVMQVSAKIGVADPANLQKPPVGVAIIFATTSYYGRAPNPVWDWIQAKLQSPPNG